VNRGKDAMKNLLVISLLLLAPWSAQASIILGDDGILENDISRITGLGGGTTSFSSVVTLSINSPNVGNVDFSTPGDSVILNFVASSLADTIQINPLDSLFDANVEVLTGAGNDTFMLNAITGPGSYLINGGADADLLDLTGLAGMLTTNGTEIFQDGSLILNYLNIEEIKGLVSGPESPESPSPIPVPAAVWLFGTALIGLVGFSKRRKAA
jgi:hypothetical protein